MTTGPCTSSVIGVAGAGGPARNVLAIAADHAVDGKGLPVFSLEDTTIAELIQGKTGR